MSKPVILAFGYLAGAGKGACVEYLSKAYGACNILKVSFASALRKEIHQEVQKIAAQYMCPPKEALEILCYRKGVQHDPFAKADTLNPHGKQRKLQQFWGTEYRRAQCATYWLDQVELAIEQHKPGIVLIDDLRFLNEANWVKSQGGTTVHVYRPDFTLLTGDAAKHVSENQLADYAFDHTIVNDGSLKQLHPKANKVFHSVTQQNLF